jgi:hypothetical protein
MEIGKQIDEKNPSRQDRLRSWLALHKIRHGDLALALGVHPSMITRIVNGDRAPARRIGELAKLGIPRELLPEPSRSPGRPPGAKNAPHKAARPSVEPSDCPDKES